MNIKEPLKYYDGYFHCEECDGWPAAGGCPQHPEAKICGACASVHRNAHGKQAEENNLRHIEKHAMIFGPKETLKLLKELGIDLDEE